MNRRRVSSWLAPIYGNNVNLNKMEIVYYIITFNKFNLANKDERKRRVLSHMREQFNTGFSELSYLSLIKGVAESIYKNSIAAPSNKNREYQTNGLIFNYLNDEDINAYTSIMNGYDHLVVNTGTVTKIYEYFFSVFSSKEMFLNIGNPSAEQGIEVLAKFDYSSKQILLTGRPNDQSRCTVAEYTSLLAIRYIIAHELGHMLNGHTYLIKNLYSVPKVEMIFKSLVFNLSHGDLTDYALDRRTLEMDADAFAATIGITNLIGIIDPSKEFGDFIDCLEQPLQIFELWTFAIHSIFMIFELENPSNYSNTSFYLPNNAREALNLSSAMITLDFMISKGYFVCSDERYSLIKNYFKSGINKAESFFNAYRHTNFHFISNFLNNVDTGIYCDRVLDHWNKKMRARLQDYTRAILYNNEGMDL